MRDRVNLLLVALCLIGSGCVLGDILAKLGAWPRPGDLLSQIGSVAMWSLAVGIIVQKATRAAAAAEASRPDVAVPKDWLPDVVGVFIAEDLVPEMKRCQSAIMTAVAAVRGRHGVEAPIVRIRDDSLLASRSYAVSVNGIRICGATLGALEDFQTQLTAALEDVWNHHADAIRYFAHVRAQAA